MPEAQHAPDPPQPMGRRHLQHTLHHILQAAADAASLTRGKSAKDYEQDRFLRLAVERCPEIISELPASFRTS